MTLLSCKKSGGEKGIKLKKDDVITFTQTLSLLLNSNLSLKDSLNVALTTTNKKEIKNLINIIISGLTKGETFSEILKENAYGFPPLYIGLIRVGEKTGTLKKVLSQLDIYLERDKQVKDKLQGALIYPAFIMGMTVVFSIVFVFLILPKLNEMFSSMGGSISDVLKARGQVFTYIVLIGIGILAGFTTFILYIKSLAKKDINKAAGYEKYFLKIPGLGNYILESQTLNLIFALKVLTGSSLSVEESLDFGKEVLNNSYLKLQVEKVKRDIINGEKLSLAFSNGIFPDKISSFIKVGEKTGDIHQIFSQLSEYYLKENDKKIDTFMTMIEPIILMSTGASMILLIMVFIFPVLTNMGVML